MKNSKGGGTCVDEQRSECSFHASDTKDGDKVVKMAGLELCIDRDL